MDWIAALLPHKKKPGQGFKEPFARWQTWRGVNTRITARLTRSSARSSIRFSGSRTTERAFIALSLYLRYGGKPQDEIVTAYNSLLSKRAIRRAEVLGLALRLAYRISGGSPTLLMQHLGHQGWSAVGHAATERRRARNSRIISTIKSLCAARNLKPGAVRATRNPATDMAYRYAIYYSPSTESDLGAFGAEWLGRTIAGEDLAPPRLSGCHWMTGKRQSPRHVNTGSTQP